MPSMWFYSHQCDFIAINVIFININVIFININVIFIAINVIFININVVFITINVLLWATSLKTRVKKITSDLEEYHSNRSPEDLQGTKIQLKRRVGIGYITEDKSDLGSRDRNTSMIIRMNRHIKFNYFKHI